MYSFYSKTVFTFLLLLITFEPLELKQSYIPHLKVLMCGINALGAQWCDYILIQCYTDLKLALLLHKTVFVTFLLASAVARYCGHKVEVGSKIFFILLTIIAASTYLYGMYYCCKSSNDHLCAMLVYPFNG